MLAFFIVSTKLKKIEYKSSVAKSKYEMEIPANYYDHGTVIGGIEKEELYFYRDTACIYI
jgi:hypothetical protein